MPRSPAQSAAMPTSELASARHLHNTQFHIDLEWNEQWDSVGTLTILEDSAYFNSHSLSASALLRFVEDSAALRAADDFFLRANLKIGLGVHLHVASGTDTMLDGDKRNAILALEKSGIAVEKVFVDSFGGRLPFGLELGFSDIEILLSSYERGHVRLDFLFLHIMCFLSGLKCGFKALGFFHQDKLAIFDLNDGFFRVVG